MLQIIIDIISILWLSILTVIIILQRHSSFKAKIVKNKKDTKAKRYIVFYVVLEQNDPVKINVSDLETAIRNSVKELLGRLWLEIANPRIIMYLEDKKQGIISTNRAGYKAVLASLPLVKNVGNIPVLIVPKRTTGSLKKAKRLLGIR